MNKASYPRLRLYTTKSDYFKFILSLFNLKFFKVKDLNQTEKFIRKYINTKYYINMPMARTGIYFAVKAIITKKRNEIVLSPYTISDVINMVICAGGKPVFVDIEKNSCNIDAKKIQKKINHKTAAIMITHFYGNLCDVKNIRKIANRNEIKLIEDCAQSFGGKIDNRIVGTYGDIGIYSYGLYKSLTSFIGGSLVTNDKLIFDKIEFLLEKKLSYSLLPVFNKIIIAFITDLATNIFIFKNITFYFIKFINKYNIQYFNFFLNPMKIIEQNPKIKKNVPKKYLYMPTFFQQEILINKLQYVDSDIVKRIQKANIYFNGLKNIKELKMFNPKEKYSNIFTQYIILYKNRDSLIKFCFENGRDITAGYHKNCADLDCFKEYYEDCPNARNIENSIIYLPVYPTYKDEEIIKNIKIIKSYFN